MRDETARHARRKWSSPRSKPSAFTGPPSTIATSKSRASMAKLSNCRGGERTVSGRAKDRRQSKVNGAPPIPHQPYQRPPAQRGRHPGGPTITASKSSLLSVRKGNISLLRNLTLAYANANIAHRQPDCHIRVRQATNGGCKQRAAAHREPV